MIGRAELERDLVIVVCAVSAGIHAALTPEHFGEGAGAGLGFLVSAVLLAGLVVALTRSAGPPAIAATVLTLTGLIVAYVLAVASGVPVLLPEAEPVDGLALVTKAVEVVGLVAAVHLLLQGCSPAFIRTEGKLT